MRRVRRRQPSAVELIRPSSRVVPLDRKGIALMDRGVPFALPSAVELRDEVVAGPGYVWG
jgi:hypothetical protein